MARAYAGIFASALFLGMTTVRAGHDPVRQTISEWLVGPNALPVQVTFLIYGLTLLAAVSSSVAAALPGRRGTTATVALAITLGLGCVSLPLLPPEAWPPSSMRWPGVVHLIAAAVLFTGMPAMCFSLARATAGLPAWRRMSRVSAVVGALCAAVLIGGVIDLSINPGGFSATHLGLVERAEVELFVAWQGVLSLNLVAALHRRTP